MSDPTLDLQLDRVEGGTEERELRCTFCEEAITTSYFDFGGRSVCQTCRGRAEAEVAARPGVAGFARAVGLGLLAAAVGAGIYYAVLAATGYSVGLVAILVGYMVGQAVHRGSRGRGGWPYQTLAVVLTYMAIVSTYIPLMFKEWEKTEASTATAQLAAGEETGAATAAEVQTQEATVGLGELFLAIGVIFGVAAAIPFLAGVKNLFLLVIIAVGLFEAWKINRRQGMEITGPYEVGRLAEATPAAS